MTTRLLTFGDSNTHGSRPLTARGLFHRYGSATRWPTVAHRALGHGWKLVEEGLPGRTAQFPDPVMGAHMDGREGLKIALGSHLPVDVLTIMLGTNDCKSRFGASAEKIASGIAGLIDIAQTLDNLARHPNLRILVIAPPVILEQGPIAAEFRGAHEKSCALAGLYRELAEARGAAFFDAGSIIESSHLDGIHFEAEAHQTLGAAIAEALRGMTAP